jgi:hypothetical protein
MPVPYASNILEEGVPVLPCDKVRIHCSHNRATQSVVTCLTRMMRVAKGKRGSLHQIQFPQECEACETGIFLLSLYKNIVFEPKRRKCKGCGSVLPIEDFPMVRYSMRSTRCNVCYPLYKKESQDRYTDKHFYHKGEILCL